MLIKSVFTFLLVGGFVLGSSSAQGRGSNSATKATIRESANRNINNPNAALINRKKGAIRRGESISASLLEDIKIEDRPPTIDVGGRPASEVLKPGSDGSGIGGSNAASTDDGKKVMIVRLSEESAAEAHARGGDSKQARKAASAQQTEFLETVTDLDPGAIIWAQIQVVLNAVFVEVDSTVISQIADDARVVRISPVSDYELIRPKKQHLEVDRRKLLEATVPYLGADVVHGNGIDGQDVTIAVLDTGIDYLHENLGGSGSQAEFDANDDTVIEGDSFPTEKVIGGYDFVGPHWPTYGDLAPDEDPLDKGELAGHGTHVADIIAGINGMAPSALLYAVQVCSAVSSACSGIALIQGVDFACDPNGDGDLSDHVDVINMSLGSFYGQPFDDDLSAAVDVATSMGVLTVGAAGNSGDKPYVVATPSAARTAISVAQTTLPSDIHQMFVVQPTDTTHLAIPQRWAGELTATIDAPVQYGDGMGGNLDGCAPFASGSLTGKIVLVDRGTCYFSSKISNIADGDGLIGIIGLVAPGEPFTGGFGDGDPSRIPGYMVSQATADVLRSSTTANFDPTNFVPLAGAVVGSSSRGPQNGDKTLIKPEIGAPGAAMSAVAGSGDGERNFGGTSGAAPVISGAAALVIHANIGNSVSSGKKGKKGRKLNCKSKSSKSKSKGKGKGTSKSKSSKSKSIKSKSQGKGKGQCKKGTSSRLLRGGRTLKKGKESKKGGGVEKLSPLQIKSLLMNNAETEIMDDGQSSNLAPISRIGGGEVRVDRAVEANIIAYDEDYFSGALSFGFIDVADDEVVLEKTVVIENLPGLDDDDCGGCEDAVYSITSTFRFEDDELNGAVTLDFPPSVTLLADEDVTTFTVTMRIDGTKLRGNYMNALLEGGNGETLTINEYDGYIILNNTDDGRLTQLAWHVLPRKAAHVVPDTDIIPPDVFSGSIGFDNQGVGAAQNGGFALIATSPNKTEGLRGQQNPKPDIRAVGVATYVFNGVCSFIWAFAINTWERQEHPLPVSHQIWMDVDRDGEADYVILNRDVSFWGGSDGRQLTWVYDLHTGYINAWFYANHPTNSGNMVLYVCGEQLGMSYGDILSTNVDIEVYTQDFYFGGEGDFIPERLTVMPWGERFEPYTAGTIDVPGNTYDANGLQYIDWGSGWGDNTPELGMMVMTDSYRGYGNSGGATQETEALLFYV